MGKYDNTECRFTKCPKGDKIVRGYFLHELVDGEWVADCSKPCTRDGDVWRLEDTKEIVPGPSNEKSGEAADDCDDDKG